MNVLWRHPLSLTLTRSRLRLVQLEHREADAERRVVKLQDRNATFPSEMGGRQVEEAHRTLLVMRREMNDLRAQLLPIMRLRDPASPLD